MYNPAVGYCQGQRQCGSCHSQDTHAQEWKRRGVGGGQFELLCKLVCVCVRACVCVRGVHPSPSPVKNGGEFVKVYRHHRVM